MQTSARMRIPGVTYLPDERVKKYAQDGTLGQTALPQALSEAFERYATNIAISDLDNQITFQQLQEKTTRLAAALRKRGLEPYDRVIFQLPNTIETYICLIACLKAELIPVCTLQAHRSSEISFLARQSNAKGHIIVSDESKFDYVKFAKEMQQEAQSLQHIIVAIGDAPGGTTGLQQLIDSVSKEEAEAYISSLDYDPFQVCLFQLSGGTSGIPKLIPRFSNDYLLQIKSVVNRLSITSSDRAFMPTPILHNANIGCVTLPTLISGGRVLVNRAMNPKLLFKNLFFKRPTITGLVGPVLEKLKALGFANRFKPTPRGILGWYLLKSLRIAITTNMARQCHEILNINGVQIYGTTEGVIMLPKPTDSNEARWESQGSPVSDQDEVRIVKQGTEEDVEFGEIGEMITRGPYTICGYFDAEEKNKETFTSDGFYRSGDLMRAKKIDGEVRYKFEGRLKDNIDRGAEKIHCEEVEEFVRRHDAVSDVLVVPYPCPVLGERGCACIIPTDNHTAPNVAELGAFLETQGLAKFKWPERIEVYEDFPMTKSGKPSKPLLKQELATKVAQEQ